MKPKLLLPILLLFGLSCSAQIYFNVKAGVNLSFFRNYNNVAYSSGPFGKIDEKPKFGIQVGLGSDVKLSDDISLRPEIIYNQKGILVEDNDQSIYTSGPNSGYEMTWHYIDFSDFIKDEGS